MREKTTSLSYQTEPHRFCLGDVASGSLGNVSERTYTVLAVSRLSLKMFDAPVVPAVSLNWFPHPRFSFSTPWPTPYTDLDSTSVWIVSSLVNHLHP